MSNIYTGSRMGGQGGLFKNLEMDVILDQSVKEVSQVFPDVDLEVIRKDLNLTLNAEQTINRILDGTVYNSSPEKSGSAWTCSSTDVNSDSDLELPILTQRVRPTNLILRLSDQASKDTSNDIIDLSQDKDLSDTDVNSDDGGLPDLEPAPLKYKPDNQIDLTQEVILTSDSDNIVLESQNNCDPLENTSEKTRSPLHQGISVDYISEQQPLQMSDSEDSAPGASLANRLGLAERCGFNFKLGVSPKTSTECVEEDYGIPDSFRGVKRKNIANILVEAGQTDNMAAMSEDAPAKKSKKKRTAEEIAESKRQAEEKRAERQRVQEEKKAQKQREIELRRALQENKRHFRAGDCVKYLTVCVDPGVINAGQLGAGVFKVCGDLGAKCVTEPQLVPNTITWTREVLDCQQDTAVKRAVLEDDILTMLPLQDFIAMVQTYVQNQQGLRQPGSVTVKEFIQSLQGVYPTKTVAVFVMGKEKYFSDLKLSNKRNHREAVLGTGGAEGLKQKKSKKGAGSNIVITRVQMEEALIDAQLHTSCIVQFAETSQDAADLVKSFTKAVADKPAKKDRLENVFDFLAEGAAGVKVDKSGAGLLKVWKHQLLQFKNVGPDMAEAIISAYPSPRLLYQAYQNCSTEKEGQKLLENIVVRRGAGVLVTNRRIGKELSRRIHSLFQSTDENFIIK